MSEQQDKFTKEKTTKPSPHCNPDPKDEWDDKVCSCAAEPYMVEWLEREEKKAAGKKPAAPPAGGEEP